MDREAAKHAFDGFLSGRTLVAIQIQFVNLVIGYLTQSGRRSPGQLYESPFTNFSPLGVDGVSDPAQVGQILTVLNAIGEEPGASQ
jgi:type I restriction enzyme R subunit